MPDYRYPSGKIWVDVEWEGGSRGHYLYIGQDDDGRQIIKDKRGKFVCVSPDAKVYVSPNQSADRNPPF